MPARYFTPEEANALLPQLRPVAERMVALARSLARAERRHAELLARIAGNGGDLPPSELAESAGAVEREADALARCVERIGELGGQVKDLETGLVDFPALRDGAEVLLCWRLGEEAVAHWHPVDAGFAGRQPL